MVSPLRTKSVSLKVKVLPSMAFELYVYSTINSSLSLITSPSVRGLLVSNSFFFLSIINKILSFDLYLPSAGFKASAGIFQPRPS